MVRKGCETVWRKGNSRVSLRWDMCFVSSRVVSSRFLRHFHVISLLTLLDSPISDEEFTFDDEEFVSVPSANTVTSAYTYSFANGFKARPKLQPITHALTTSTVGEEMSDDQILAPTAVIYQNGRNKGTPRQGRVSPSRKSSPRKRLVNEEKHKRATSIDSMNNNILEGMRIVTSPDFLPVPPPPHLSNGVPNFSVPSFPHVTINEDSLYTQVRQEEG